MALELKCRNQPNKTKLALKLLFSPNLIICKIEGISHKDGCGVRASKNLTEELAWTLDNSFGFLVMYNVT